MEEVEEIEILPGSFADHKPILLTIKDIPKSNLWRFNTSHLRNKKIVEEVKREMTEFFKINNQKETSKITTWETAKAFFRGLAIRQDIRQKREKVKGYKELLAKLKKEEDYPKKNPSCEQCKIQINLLQHQINILLMEEVEEKK